MNNSIASSLFAIVSLIVLFANVVNGMSLAIDACNQLEGIPEMDLTKCEHGVVTNPCGTNECLRGPGETCGKGIFELVGTCGEGTTCKCGRCMGCSLKTFQCFDKTCV